MTPHPPQAEQSRGAPEQLKVVFTLQMDNLFTLYFRRKVTTEEFNKCRELLELAREAVVEDAPAAERSVADEG